MRRFLCVCALVLAAVMLMAGCEAAGTFSQAESTPVQTSIPESEPESQAESAPEQQHIPQSVLPDMPDVREIIVQAGESAVTEELQIRETNKLEDLL